MPRLLAALLALAAVLAWARPGEAAPPATYLVEAGGAVRAVRTADVDGDGRQDVVAHVVPEDGPEQIVVFRTPAKPVKRSLYPADHIVRIPCTGSRARAGAVAVGHFGPVGPRSAGAPGPAFRIRFLGPEGIEDVKPDGTPGETGPRYKRPTLLARSAGRELVFWDAVGNLDASPGEECWFPDGAGDGLIRVFGGRAGGDRMLSVAATNRASADHLHGMLRTSYVPNLFAVDVDGKGSDELVALQDNHLVAWAPGAADPGKPLQPFWRVHLPFLDVAPDEDPETLRTARIQFESLRRGGPADLLVTVIAGKRTNLLSLRTILFHYRGPIRDDATGTLVKPASRIDTQSIVLHPTFVDVDGDGWKDYVGDSIRGTMLDLIARLMGQDPKITYVGFRYDTSRRTFEPTPWFTLERLYASKEALNNTFGRAAWFGADFDGDEKPDVLDLGNLSSVTLLSGAGEKPAFDKPLLGPIPVKGGLASDARIADLSGDGVADAVLWGGSKLYILLSRGAR